MHEEKIRFPVLNSMSDMPQLSKYIFGIILGLVLSVLVFLTNFVFPNNSSDNVAVVGSIYLILFSLFICIGYFQKDIKVSLRNGIISGSISAVIAFLITMLTFIIIDNLFLNIVSEQREKIWAFSHQNTYHNMRDFINYGLIKGTFFGTIMAALFGGLAGAIGTEIKKFRVNKSKT